MGWTPMDIIAGVLKPVGDFFNRRQEIKAVQHQNEVDLLKAQGERQAKLASDGLTADAAWEMEFARQAGTSWKDEYELIVVSIPTVMCFVPGWDVYVFKGFQALSQTPSWFQFLLVTIFLANYGIRYWRKTQSDT